jgi:hypothetical protein
MLKIQARLRASRDRFYVVSGICLLLVIGILVRIANEVVLGDALMQDNRQTFLLLLACVAGCFFSYRAGGRCRTQMEGETRRWKENLKGE